MWFDVTMLIIGGIAIVAGIAGCFIPVIPGPIVSYCGLLCMAPTAKSPSTTVLVAFGVVTAVVTALDYIVPAIGAKKFNCSKLGVWGCTIGAVVGMFFFPLGLLLGPFLGAVAGELLAKKPVGAAALGGLGALIVVSALISPGIVPCPGTLHGKSGGLGGNRAKRRAAGRRRASGHGADGPGR